MITGTLGWNSDFTVHSPPAYSCHYFPLISKEQKSLGEVTNWFIFFPDGNVVPKKERMGEHQDTYVDEGEVSWREEWVPPRSGVAKETCSALQHQYAWGVVWSAPGSSCRLIANVSLQLYIQLHRGGSLKLRRYLHHGNWQILPIRSSFLSFAWSAAVKHLKAYQRLWLIDHE